MDIIKEKVQINYAIKQKESRGKHMLLKIIKKDKANLKSNTGTNSLREILVPWLTKKKTEIKESSLAKYHGMLKNHIVPLLGYFKLEDINDEVLNDFTKELLHRKDTNNRRVLADKTICDIVRLTMSVLKDAGVKVKTPKSLPSEKGKPIRILTLEEQKALEEFLLERIDEYRYLGIIMCLYTGIRIGEVCALKWKDISIKKKRLYVNYTLQRIKDVDGSSSEKTKISITNPKSECSIRSVPLPECLIEYLINIMPLDPEAYFLTGIPNKFIEPRAYQYFFKSCLELAEVDDIKFHSLRHTFASRCVEIGFDIKCLSEILGHACVEITMNKYVHPSYELKQRNMNKLTFIA